jgi:aromatic ring hydroxylase
MDVEKLLTLVDYLQKSNGTTEMDQMRFINGVNDLCVSVKSLLNDYLHSKGDTFKYKWMDIQAAEWSKEDLKILDQKFIENLDNILDGEH